MRYGDVAHFTTSLLHFVELRTAQVVSTDYYAMSDIILNMTISLLCNSLNQSHTS